MATDTGSDNPHFAYPATWEEAAELVTFAPRQPRVTDGSELRSLAVHVRDHRSRELPAGDRSLEAFYDRFVLSQCHKGPEAERWALHTAYGPDPREARRRGRAGRMYELGPHPEPDDPDPRSPALVVWHDDGMMCLVASDTLPAQDLVEIAQSVYADELSDQ